jgi:2,3-bisphosphoglycerate-independent phosphoglycerate mutase
MNKTILVILDGWGLGKDTARSAVSLAKTPVMDDLMKRYPQSALTTHGEAVGLPDGQMGNSEVGHLNIGAGRIVYQDLVKINKAIEEGKLDERGKLRKMAERTEKAGGNIHLIGLCSDGGVHSHIDHLYGICDYLDDILNNKYYIHAITDGRDTDPKSGLKIVEKILDFSGKSKARLGTIIGRYYAMDRDRRWERTKIAWDALVNRIGERVENPLTWMKQKYESGQTDEFLLPGIIEGGDEGSIPPIKDGDLVFFFNFRTDRPRQLTVALSQKDFPDIGMYTLDIGFLTLTKYDTQFKGVEVLFEKDNLRETLGEVISKANRSQLRIAETEKYPHVTFFFSGGREEKFTGEDRILIPSPKVPTYDLQPEMSAREVTDTLIGYLKENTPAFICLNYANPDMVGHTGVLEAAVKAVETVDECLGMLIPVCREKGYEILIIADHGNSDYMINNDGSPNTAHTINLVPCLYIGQSIDEFDLRDGILADVAPTLLDLMNLPQPKSMTGKSLLTKKSLPDE